MSPPNANMQLQPEPRSLDHSFSRQRSKLSLSSSLLTTTELEPLVRGFAAEVRARLPCDGIEFVDAERGVRVRDGEIRLHSCRYTLKIRDWVAGQMNFTRGRRFTKDELALLETLLTELLFPLRRALMHRRPTKRGSGTDGDRTEVGSRQRPRSETTLAAPRREQSAVAPKTRLSLVPLGEDGDYPSELTEPSLQEREPALFPGIADSGLASAPADWAVSHDGDLDRKQRALLAKTIIRSGINEQELFKEAREVLGYLAYSDEALVFMSVYSDEALGLPGDGPARAAAANAQGLARAHTEERSGSAVDRL